MRAVRRVLRRTGLRLLRPLSTSTVSALWLARHPAADRPLCLKVVDPGRCESARAWDQRRDNLLKEAAFLKRLEHPGIPKLYVSSPEGDYLLMEYVSGMPLSRLLGRLTWPQIRAIAEDLSRILLYLHTLPRPVIHRDVKPKNIIVRHDGRVWRTWLVDFGSAEWEVQPRREHPPRPVKLGYGAFLYQPPEQLLADYAQLDRHADYFALGATLHAMIFGFPPYSNTERRSTSVRAAYREQERRLWTSKRLQHLPSVIREDLFQLLRFSPDLRQLPPSWLWPSSFGTGAGNR